MLLDSAYIQEMEAEWQTRKARRAGRRGVEPLYDQDDARKTIPLLKPVDYGKPQGVGSRRDRGLPRRRAHPGLGLPGAAARGAAARRSRCSSAATSASPTSPSSATRRSSSRPTTSSWSPPTATACTHRDGEPEDELAEILEEAKRTGGNVIIPAFAVGRTQEILYFLREIFEKTDLDMPVYVDSPLASRATEIFRRHREVFDEEAWKLVGEPGGIFDFPQLHYTDERRRIASAQRARRASSSSRRAAWPTPGASATT